MTKLHLGCGEAKIDGFLNIDFRYLPSVDMVDNVKHLRRFKPNQVEMIYACHVLEHISRWEYKGVLGRWHEILQPGGTLRVAVPNFGAICDYYQKTGDLRAVSGMLYGGQDYDGNQHYWCWDFDALKGDLEGVGFTAVRCYDWRETEHAEVDDFSQAYLPHMDKENGMLMSLNVEATKK